MGVSLVTDAQVVGLICLGLVSTVAAGLAWNAVAARPSARSSRPALGASTPCSAATDRKIAPAASTASSYLTD